MTWWRSRQGCFFRVQELITTFHGIHCKKALRSILRDYFQTCIIMIFKSCCSFSPFVEYLVMLPLTNILSILLLSWRMCLRKCSFPKEKAASILHFPWKLQNSLLQAHWNRKGILPLFHHNCWATFYKEFVSSTRRSCENSPMTTQAFIIDLVAMKICKVSVHPLWKKSSSPPCASLFIVRTISTLIKSVKVEYDTLWDIDLAWDCLSGVDNTNCSHGDLSAMLVTVLGSGLSTPCSWIRGERWTLFIKIRSPEG